MLIEVTAFHNFLKQCQKSQFDGFSRIFAPVLKYDNDLNLEVLDDSSEIVLDKYRTQDPAKIILYHFREAVTGTEYPSEKIIIAGLKSCDLNAIHLLDKALINNDFYDPAYLHWRQNTLLITCDCTEIRDSCHCTLVNGKPFIEKGFDINLSPINEYYLLKSGSDKGKRFIELLQEHVNLSPVNNEIFKTLENQRTQLFNLLQKNNQKFKYSNDYIDAKPPAWKDNSHNCIGCGACTNICPTCYCLILNDESKPRQFIKVRSYDSCQLNGYARVAGGASPRPEMNDRFRNRYLCKFCFMESNFNEPGCTGCGRCIEACPALIDIREVVHRINEKKDHFSQHEEQHV